MRKVWSGVDRCGMVGWLVLPFLMGCGNAPFAFSASEGVSRSVASPLQGGAYEGNNLCTSSVAISGEEPISQTVETPLAVEVSVFGLPMSDGRELAAGRLFRQDFGGFVTEDTIRDVAVSDAGVVVTSESSLTGEQEGGGALELRGQGVETYVPGAAGEINYSANWSLSSVDTPSVLRVTIECTGLLRR